MSIRGDYSIFDKIVLVIISYRSRNDFNFVRLAVEPTFPNFPKSRSLGLRNQLVCIMSVQDDYSIFNEIVRVIILYRSRSDFNFVRLAVEPVFPNFPKISNLTNLNVVESIEGFRVKSTNRLRKDRRTFKCGVID